MASNTFRGEAKSQSNELYQYEATWTVEKQVAWSAVVQRGGLWKAHPAGLISLPIVDVAGGIDAAVRAQVEAAIFDLDPVTQPAVRQPPKPADQR